MITTFTIWVQHEREQTDTITEIVKTALRDNNYLNENALINIVIRETVNGDRHYIAHIKRIR